MQSVQLLCLCCLCCIKCIQCSCKDQRSRRISMPFFFVLSLLLVGALFWSIGLIDNLKEQNQQYNPNKQECAVVCGTQYREEGAKNRCCWDSANDCKSKTQCQQMWNDFYDTLSLTCKILIGASSAYALIFIIVTITRAIRKFRYDRHPPQIQPLLLLRQDQDLAVNRSDTSSRLRESVLVRDSNLCSICLEGYQDQKAISLDCNHMYHSECIRIWVKKHNTCPLCRGQI